MKIAVVNLKGGVGKTISAVHLAANLGRQRATVLVDADPQGSAATWAILAPELPHATVSLGVSTLGLRLPEATRGYEHVIIDTPPGDAMLVRAAVMFSDLVLIPVQPTLQDLNRLRPTLELIAGLMPHEPDVKVLLTRVRAGTRSARESRASLEALGLSVLMTEIPLLEAYSWGFGMCPPEGHRYGALTDELLRSWAVAA